MSTQNTSKPTKSNYAFIDSQNLHLGVAQDIYDVQGKLIYTGWKLDLKKFRIYLKDKFGVSRAYLFLGYLPQLQGMYQDFRNFGYDLIFKDVIIDHSGKPKGNIDAELVLQSAAIDYSNYNKAVIVTGDGDFKCLVKYLLADSKLEALMIPNKIRYSSLLRNYSQCMDFISNKRHILEY